MKRPEQQLKKRQSAQYSKSAACRPLKALILRGGVRINTLAVKQHKKCRH
ncbi:hypothetical protein [Shewanella mangrovi]|nr:hypothetical protein [Shewanella mangrovi]